MKGIPNPENPSRKRLERLAERRRRQARQSEAQQEPNRDFDFGSDPPQPKR